MRYLETLVSNRGGNIRREHVDGRDYLVAPLSMIVPGVLNGSKGPLLYPLDEISRNADQWNNIPIVVHHPMDGGRAISARSPVLERYQLGTVYNARVSDKLRAEGWFDVERTKRLAPDTYASWSRVSRRNSAPVCCLLGHRSNHRVPRMERRGLLPGEHRRGLVRPRGAAARDLFLLRHRGAERIGGGQLR